jgi:hypothetical protein
VDFGAYLDVTERADELGVPDECHGEIWQVW